MTNGASVQGRPKAGRIEAFAAGSGTRVRMPFFWGLAEASFFIIIPDLIIGFTALWNLRYGLWASLWAVAGALIGGTLVFLWPEAWQGFFPHLFGISSEMMQAVEQRFEGSGWWAMIVAPAGGFPYKLFAAEAALDDRNIFAFWAVTAVARAWRFVLVAMVAGGIGHLARRLLRSRPVLCTATYSTFWSLVYVQYYVTVAVAYGL